MHELNPAIPIGQTAASVPPATITSARPRRIISSASPIESVPVAQAETVEKLGPFAPIIIETCPEAMSPSIIGTRNGLTRFGPLLSMISCCSVIVMIPPTPLPIRTPTRAASSAAISMPASSSASTVASQANWANRSSLLDSLRPSEPAASKSSTSAAMRVTKPSASNNEI